LPEEISPAREIPYATPVITLCVVALCFVALIVPGLFSLMLAGDITVLCVLFAVIAAFAVLSGAIVVARRKDRAGQVVFAVAAISAIASASMFFTVAMALCVAVGVFGFIACRRSRAILSPQRVEPT